LRLVFARTAMAGKTLRAVVLRSASRTWTFAVSPCRGSPVCPPSRASRMRSGPRSWMTRRPWLGRNPGSRAPASRTSTRRRFGRRRPVPCSGGL